MVDRRSKFVEKNPNLGASSNGAQDHINGLGKKGIGRPNFIHQIEMITSKGTVSLDDIIDDVDIAFVVERKEPSQNTKNEDAHNDTPSGNGDVEHGELSASSATATVFALHLGDRCLFFCDDTWNVLYRAHVIPIVA